jgi:hypothetical protein
MIETPASTPLHIAPETRSEQHLRMIRYGIVYIAVLLTCVAIACIVGAIVVVHAVDQLNSAVSGVSQSSPFCVNGSC